MNTGDLSEKSLPHLLLDLYASAQSGILKAWREKIEKKIHFMMGKPIFASSNEPQDRMGALLHRRGIITEEQLEESLRESTESGKRLGTVLVEKGLLEPEQLVAAVVDQVEEIIYSLFEWDEGMYSFEPGDPVTDEVITLDLSALSIINEGVKRKYSPERLEKVLGSPTTVLRMNPNPAYQIHDLQMTPEQEEILNAIDGQKTIQELIAVGENCGIAVSDVSIFLCGLLLSSIVEIEGEAGHPSSDEEPQGDRMPTDASSLETAPSSPSTPEPSPADARPAASAAQGPEGIRAEILRMHRDFPRMTLFDKLGLARTAGKGEVLSFYNKLMKKYKPEKLGPEFDDIRDKARSVFSQIEEAYAILFRDDTRAKYDHDLGKKSGLAYDEIEAAEVLEEPAGEDPAHARQIFEKAKALFQEKRYSEAVGAFEEAIRIDPGVSEYYTGLALIHATDFPGHEPDRDKAERLFLKAVSLNPSEGRNYYYLGVIYKSREEWEKAENFFRKVLELVPDHPEARRQIEWLAQVKA